MKLDELGIRRPLLVTDPGLRELSLVAGIESLVDEAGLPLVAVTTLARLMKSLSE